MNPPIRRTIVSILSAAALCQSASAALIANWDFSTGTTADLTSSIGGYTFARIPGVGPGVGNAPVHNVGSISLDQYTELNVTDLNSTTLPGLMNNATIYVRMKFDAPLGGSGFFFGLQNSTAPSGFGQQSLIGFASSTTAVAGYGYGNAGFEAYAGAATLPSAGTYFTMALVLTADPLANSVQWRMNFNGTEYSSVATGTSMQAFQSFAIGQLASSQGVGPMTFDTIQIYNTSLTAAEIAAIPEPSMVGVYMVGALAFLGFLRRRQRRAALAQV